MQTEAAPEQVQHTPYWLRFIFGRNPAWTFVRILFVVLVSLFLFKFVLVPIRVTGDSMLPNYRNGQIKFVNRLAFAKIDPQRGEVVAVEFQSGKEILLLKRIIGLPGETFQVQEGEVLINGRKIEEPYAHGKILSLAPRRLGHPDPLGNTDPIPLGPDEYMVIGDNRKISEGYIKKRSEIVGKVL
jgi:signal peptidase I